jgi:hypothetical protein
MQMSRSRRSARSGAARRFGKLAAFVILAVAPLGAQSPLLTGMNAVGNPGGGFQLYSLTGYAGWESTASPQGGFYLPATSGSAGLKGDDLLGGGATVGWSHLGRKTNLSIIYTASYQAQIRYSNLSALNQFLTLNGSRQLSRKWTLGFSAASSISTYDQMLFTPTILSGVAAAPGTFDDLSAALLAGKYNNDQLASLLTGAPVIESPARTVLFGDRVFTSSASTSLSYAHSQRLSISLAASANRSENIPGAQGSPQYLYLIPQAIEASATVGINYSLTPRTQVGVNMSASRGFSRIEDAYASYANAFIGRTMGRHWFAQVHAGGGFITPVRSQFAVSHGTTPVYGANLGYRAYAHTFLVSQDRTLSQSYGAGAAATTMTSAAWHWSRPGRSWGASSEYMRMQFSGGPFGNVNGWRASFGLNRHLGERLMLQTGYSYASYASNSPVSPYNSSQHAVRLSVMWMPAGERR